MEALNNAEREMRVEHLNNLCEEAMTDAFGKQNQIYSFADKTTNFEAWKIGFKRWMSEVTVENDKVLKKVRECIDGSPQTEYTSQSAIKTRQKAKSTSQTSKTSAFRISKTSSQRQRELLVQNTDAKLFRDRRKVCCVWLNRSKNLKSSDLSKKRSY